MTLYTLLVNLTDRDWQMIGLGFAVGILPTIERRIYKIFHVLKETF
jgi:hypothetical protein